MLCGTAPDCESPFTQSSARQRVRSVGHSAEENNELPSLCSHGQLNWPYCHLNWPYGRPLAALSPHIGVKRRVVRSRKLVLPRRRDKQLSRILSHRSAMSEYPQVAMCTVYPRSALGARGPSTDRASLHLVTCALGEVAPRCCHTCAGVARQDDGIGPSLAIAHKLPSTPYPLDVLGRHSGPTECHFRLVGRVLVISSLVVRHLRPLQRRSIRPFPELLRPSPSSNNNMYTGFSCAWSAARTDNLPSPSVTHLPSGSLHRCRGVRTSQFPA